MNDDLTQAELILQNAVAAGEKCDLKDTENINHPDEISGSACSDNLIIRASFLKKVLIDSTAAQSNTAVHLIGATVKGQINLSGVSLRRPVFISESKFIPDSTGYDDSGIVATDSHLATLYLDRCVIDRSTNTDGSARYAVDMSRAMVDGSILLINSSLGGSVRAVGAVISGDFNLHGSKIGSKGTIEADRVRVSGQVFCREGFICEGGVRFPSARIGIDLDFRNGIFKSYKKYVAPVHINRAIIGGFCSFQNAKIYATGRNSIEGEDITLGTWLNLADGFRARGTVLLRRSTIGGNLNCQRGRIRRQINDVDQYAIDIENAQIGDYVFFRNATTLVGSIRMVGASIGANLEIGRSLLLNRYRVALNAERANISGNIMITPDATIVGGINMTGVTVEVVFYSGTLKFDRPILQDLLISISK